MTLPPTWRVVYDDGPQAELQPGGRRVVWACACPYCLKGLPGLCVAFMADDTDDAQ